MLWRLLEGIMGPKANDIPCLVLIDSQNLWSCVHNLTACSDNRLQADILNIRQSIHDDATIQEVRYVHNSQMIADTLTKETNMTGRMLLNVVRSGQYDIPGGAIMRDSTQTATKTWSQLVRAEEETEDPHLQEEKNDSRRNSRVRFGSVSWK